MLAPHKWYHYHRYWDFPGCKQEDDLVPESYTEFVINQ